ncbi:MAG: hypothetical protein GY786_06820 [Proteobacteria bacterium]|nr:hypothetical protein [Pseudomonadota bacterium]
MKNIQFIALDLNKKPANFQSDTIVTDPPRIGMAPSVLKIILESSASKLVYISCNPSTMIRDIKTLTGKGDFRLKELTGFDMYPHTTHLEALAILDR